MNDFFMKFTWKRILNENGRLYIHVLTSNSIESQHPLPLFVQK